MVAGQSVIYFRVPILNDLMLEASETFALQLNIVPITNGIIISPAQSEVIIRGRIVISLTFNVFICCHIVYYCVFPCGIFIIYYTWKTTFIMWHYSLIIS